MTEDVPKFHRTRAILTSSNILGLSRAPHCGPT